MFGDFLNRGKHGQLDFENIDDLEDGIRSLLDIIIGNFSLVFTGKVMLSIKIAGRRKPEFLCSVWNKVPLKGFSRIQQSMNIRPILNLIKRKRIIMQDAISRSREIVYGDDFTLMCMLDSIETHHFRHLVLAYACSFAVSCLK